jgi:hypothetical protein
MHNRSTALALVGVLVALRTGTAIACSFAPGYEEFHPGPVMRPSATLAPAPAIKVESIRRGAKGDAGMCADAGILVLTVPRAAQGYSFELVEGKFDDEVLPKGFVQPTKPGYLAFVWLDGNTDVQEPISVVVKITAMSSLGVLSEPLLLKIEDPGRGRVR